MEVNPADPVGPAPPPACVSRRTWVVIAVLVALWAAAMLLRWEIRTRWWAYRLAREPAAESRGYYLACLLSAGDKAAGAAESLLRHPSAEVRLQAVAILHRCRGARARGLLLTAMHDEDVDVREAAALGLAAFHDEAALPELVRMASSADAATATAALVGLQRIGGAAALDALLDAARGPPDRRSPAVRAQAVDSLGLVGSRAAVPVLIECLSDDRPVTMRPAAERSLRRALETLAPDLAKRGIDPKSIAEPAAPPTVADLAARALQRITGESFGFRSTDPPDRRAAVVRMYEQWWEAHRAD